MVCIGIVGDEKFQTIEMLMRLFKKEGKKSVFLDSSDLNENFLEIYKNNSFIIIRLSQSFRITIPKEIKFDVLVYLEGDKTNAVSKYLAEKNTVILNCDEESIFPFFIGIGTTLITSGFNSKATVTVSGIEEFEDGVKIQTCLQRSITSVSKKEILPMEFSVEVLKKVDASYVLAAATLAMICDITVDNMKIN